MNTRDASLDLLLRALPDVSGLAPLREALLAGSEPDPSLAWSTSRAYTTYDRRVISAADTQKALQEAAAAARKQIDELYAGVGDVLSSVSASDPAAVAARLIELGERAEAAEAPKDALAWYETAKRWADPLPDRTPAALALRRMARVRLSMGDLDDAYELYRSAQQLGVACGDDAGVAVALTGLGNVRSEQGRWADARECYAAALAHPGTGTQSNRRVHVLLNLANISREEARYEDSRTWLEQALPLWDTFGPAERSIWFAHDGSLRMALGELDPADSAFRQALDLAPTSFHRAIVLENLADLACKRARLVDAEDLARRAEEEAIAAASPWALGLVYTTLGKISRERGDADGVTFFEKALEIGRTRRLALIEAIASLEYGCFLRRLASADEARPYLERSRDLLRATSAGPDLQRAERELAEAIAASA